MNQTGLIITPNLLRVVRVFRIGRLLRFFHKATGIKRLVFSLLISLSALFNVGAILFLIMFIYALTGMSFFGHVKKTGALNDVVNFETFLNSMLLIFRLITAAGWNDVLEPLVIQPPDCDPNFKGLSNGNCGNYWLAVIYFYSFIIIIFLVLINMYVAVILENYNNILEQEKIGISGDDIDLFYQHWMIYDPSSTQYIYYRDLSDFLHTLEGNLGIRKPNKAACALLNIPLYEDDKIYCLHLLQALVRRVVTGYEEFDSEEVNVVLKRMEERFRAVFPAVTRYRQTNSTLEKNREITAARIITRAVRRYRERKRKEALGIKPSDSETRNDAGKGCNDFTTAKGNKGSRIADLLVHGNGLSDSLSSLTKNRNRGAKSASLDSPQAIGLGRVRTTGTINRGFEENRKKVTPKIKRGSVVPESLIHGRTLSDSLPDLTKTKGSTPAWKNGTSSGGTTLNTQPATSLRVPIARQAVPRIPPLKKITVMEQPREDKGALHGQQKRN